MTKSANVISEEIPGDGVITPAEQTLHAGAGSVGSESWNKQLATLFATIAAGGPELVKDINDAIAANQKADHAADIPGNAADKNRGTISAHPSAAEGKGPIVTEEEIKGLFGDEKVSAEFLTKVKALFEDAVAARTAIEAAKAKVEAEEDFSKKLDEEVKVLTDRVDSYLNYVVEEWLKDNEAAVTSTVRAEIAEEFMSKLKTLFQESYIEIPDDKIDVVAELTAKVTKLEEDLTTKINEEIETKKALEEATKTIAIQEAVAEVSVGLAETQKAKLKTLCESVEFTTKEEFVTKITALKEENFKKAGTPSNTSVKQTLISEESTSKHLDETPVEGESKVVDPRVASYVEAISRSKK